MDNSSPGKKHVEYTSMIRYLAEIEACDSSVFNESELGQMFYLDTTHCVIGKRKKKYNSFNIYDIFGSYIGKPSQHVKDLMLTELSSNEVWYTKAGHITCGMRNFNLQTMAKIY